MNLQDLTPAQLLKNYKDMVRWDHYDPTARPQPSEFELDELEAELRRRLTADEQER